MSGRTKSGRKVYGKRPGMPENDAAVKIQSLQRGRQARKEIYEREQAAVKIQSIERSRRQRERKRQQDESATKIQSLQRGRMERKRRQEREEAATKIQAIQRGRQTRKKPQVSQYDWVGNSQNDISYGGFAQSKQDMSGYAPMPVAKLANDVQQPYPMHVVHQQNTTPINWLWQ